MLNSSPRRWALICNSAFRLSMVVFPLATKNRADSQALFVKLKQGQLGVWVFIFLVVVLLLFLRY